jgi:hypothetical protein
MKTARRHGKISISESKRKVSAGSFTSWLENG